MDEGESPRRLTKDKAGEGNGDGDGYETYNDGECHPQPQPWSQPQDYCNIESWSTQQSHVLQ